MFSITDNVLVSLKLDSGKLQMSYNWRMTCNPTAELNSLSFSLRKEHFHLPDGLTGPVQTGSDAVTSQSGLLILTGNCTLVNKSLPFDILI